VSCDARYLQACILTLIARESDDSLVSSGGKLIFPLELHWKDLSSVRSGKGFPVASCSFG
jgi:hypothetical protein